MTIKTIEKAIKCRKCNFIFSAQYTACLNLFSRSNDDTAAIRSRKLVIVTRKTAQVVAVDVASDEPPIEVRGRREKPVQVPIVTKASKI